MRGRDTVGLLARAAAVSSCSCLLKSPEYSLHSVTCAYRLIHEAIEDVEELRADKRRLLEHVREVRRRSDLLLAGEEA